MKRKISLLSLVLLMIIMSTSTTFANHVENENMYKQMNDEINIEKEKLREDLYEQLKKQDALVLMEVYEEILYPEIERQIEREYAEKYGYVKPTEYRSSSGGRSYYAPRGGVVTYLTKSFDYKPTEVLIMGLDEDKSYDLVLNMSSFSAGDVVKSILGFIPKSGFSVVFTLQSMVDRLAINNIKQCGRCAKVINTYSREWNTRASIVTGWCDRFNLEVPSNAYNVSFESF